MEAQKDLHERLWESFSSLALLDIRDLEAYMQDGDLLVAATVIAPDKDPLDVLARRFTKAEVRRLHKVGLARFHTGDEEPLTVAAWSTPQEGVYTLTASLPATDRRWQKAQRAIGTAPALVGVFLDHRDFIAIGNDLVAVGDVEVSRITARHRTEGNSLNKGWPAQTARSRPGVDEAVNDVLADGYGVRSLTMTVGNDLHIHVSRSGVASLYSGDLGLFARQVVGYITNAAAQRVALLHDRARQPNRPPRRPVRLTFDRPAFATREDTGRLVAALSASQDHSVAVLHRNPYLHVTIADLRDGSNFDVMITEKDEVDVYPGFRASLGALTQLTQFIAEEFDALSITEAPTPTPVSLAELVG